MENNKVNEKATDIEYTLFLINHIKNPCADNLRKVYIKMAKDALPTFQNLDAKKLLEDTILKYSQEI